MAVGLLEVDAAPTIIAVDLASAMLGGVGPVFEAAAVDASKDLIEVFFADEEGVVLNTDLAILLIKIQRYAVVELDDEKRSERPCWRQPQNLREKFGRLPLVAAPDDGMVELHAHVAMLLVDLSVASGRQDTMILHFGLRLYGAGSIVRSFRAD